MALYSVLGNEIYFFAKRKSLSPRIAIFQHSNVRNSTMLQQCTRSTRLPSYEINIIIIHYVSYCYRVVNGQKIETNILHNFFCSLSLRDFNKHLIIFTVVDETNWTVSTSGAPNVNFRKISVRKTIWEWSTIFGIVVVKISCLPASARILEHLKHGHNFLKPIIIGSRLRDEPWGLHFSFVVLHVPHKNFESVGVSLALCYRLIRRTK